MSDATIDLSSLPSPVLITVDYETDLAARKTRLIELLTAAEIPFDVDALESDPAVILQEADNYREMLAKQAVNDVYRQTLIGFATGASLDWFAASFVAIVRQTGETDTRFRTRVLLEMEDRSGGRLSGYKAACMRVSVDIADVGAWVDRTDPLQPTVRLALMVAAGSGSASTELVSNVQAYVDRDDVKQATDIVSVQSVSIVSTSINITLQHRGGPDPALLRGAALTALQAMIASRRQPHRDIPLSAIIAAASVGGVERVIVSSPIADVVAGNGELISVSSITISSEITDG